MDHLQHVTKVVEELAEKLRRESAIDELWQVEGHSTAGKSTVLHGLAISLGDDLIPVVVSPPMGELDAGPAALLQIAATLKERGLVNGETAQLADPRRPLAEKITSVRKWIALGSGKVVLLCDEPMRWPASGAEDLHFAQRTWGVVNALLLEKGCRRVVAGKVPEGTTVTGVRDLSLRSDPLEWLRTSANWGSLADAARDVAYRPESELSRYSPLQLRFVVALTALDAAPWTASPGDLTRRALSRHVAEALSQDPSLAALRTLWTKLALIRRPFGEQLLSTLAEPSLAARARDLLRHCLLYRRDGEFVLHETLRRDALERRWLDANALRRAHATIAGVYADMYFADTTRFLDQLEAYHHATEAFDDDLLEKLSPMFVEQLDALGRTHSLAGRRERDDKQRGSLFDAAVENFRSSVNWDPANAYAHHYLAFNLDVQGKGTDDIEKHYPCAIELEPRTGWWHSRWICYLVTRGQANRAERAWDDALDALGLPGGGMTALVYEGLHVWVARLLLHRGQLDFAERVLGSVPAELRDNHVALRALTRRLDVLLETRRKRAFVPGMLMQPGWWRERPALLQLQDHGKLVRWIAARVEQVDLQEQVLRLDGAEVRVGHDEEPTPHSLEISFATFDGWNPDEKARLLGAGRFVEIGVYSTANGRSAQKRARVHPQRAWVDDDLPPIFPDPTRWLRSWTKPAD